MLVLFRRTGVRIEGVALQNSPSFHPVPTLCQGVALEGVPIRAPVDSPNTDAIDPSVGRDVRITRCTLDVGEDNIALQAGHSVPGRDVSCENITVTESILLHGRGLSIGGKTAGGVKNFTVQRGSLDGTTSRIRIKPERTRGAAWWIVARHRI